MSPDEAIQFADQALYDYCKEHLLDIERQIIKDSLEGKGYEKMQGYSSQHFKNTGRELWRKLSNALGEKVSKTNFKGALEKSIQSTKENTSDLTEEELIFPKLKQLLELKRRPEADQETLNIIRKISGKQNNERFDVQDIMSLPCQNLQKLDDLWLKFSNHKFGFSIQKQAWKKSGGKFDAGLDSDAAWAAYLGTTDRLEWRIRGDFIPRKNRTYDINKSVYGHLPSWFELTEVDMSAFAQGSIWTEKMMANQNKSIVYGRVCSPYGDFARAFDRWFTHLDRCIN